MPDRASGFCVYDDPAIAIEWLLREGANKIAYVDIDVHHGDGPQAIFWNEPRVLTASIHEYAPELWFFPGSGSPSETGGPGAPGSALNVPMPPGASDRVWLEAFRSEILPAVRALEPDVLITQLGCDTHATDPLAHLALTTASYVEAYRELHQLAHDSASGRWVATGGGGYRWAEVVPRAWTLAFAEMAGSAPLPQALPSRWIGQAEVISGARIPSMLLDPALDGNRIHDVRDQPG